MSAALESSELRRYVHALSQPLSTLSLALELERESGIPPAAADELWQECRRAVEAFEALRALLYSAQTEAGEGEGA